jgi:predicted CDP-diglyceride synthetase/phosphatidate cytidylyltransferase
MLFSSFNLSAGTARMGELDVKLRSWWQLLVLACAQQVPQVAVTFIVSLGG